MICPHFNVRTKDNKSLLCSLSGIHVSKSLSGIFEDFTKHLWQALDSFTSKNLQSIGRSDGMLLGELINILILPTNEDIITNTSIIR